MTDRLVRFFVLAGLLGFHLLSPAFVVYDPVNARFNLVTSVKTTAMLIRQIQQIQNQLRSIRYQADNLRALSGSRWDSVGRQLDQLGFVARPGHSLTYSSTDADGRFRQYFPGYTARPGTGGWSARYADRVRASQDTMRGVIDQTRADWSQRAREDELDRQLAERAASVRGRMQALQVGNEIGAEQVAQLRKLKATMMAIANAEAEYAAWRVQRDADRRRSVDAVIERSDASFRPYHDRAEFGLIPEFGTGG